MILSGLKIQEEINNGNIKISPFDEKLINPASIDIRLGEYYIYIPKRDIINRDDFYDTKKSLYDQINVVKKPITESLVLNSNGFYLMHTLESIHTEKYVAVLDGKSSIGRWGIQTHLTAGYIDPGFSGQITLEVTAAVPIKVYSGMRIGQIRFHEISGDVEKYNGNYQKDKKTSEGPIPSQIWKSF